MGPARPIKRTTDSQVESRDFFRRPRMRFPHGPKREEVIFRNAHKPFIRSLGCGYSRKPRPMMQSDHPAAFG